MWYTSAPKGLAVVFSRSHELTDDLIQAAASGSRASLESVLFWATGPVQSHVRKKLGTASAVEEISADALEALARALPRLRNRTQAGLLSFATRIAERKVFRFLVKKSAARRPTARSSNKELLPLTTTLAQRLFVDGPSPSTQAEKAERLTRILRALEALDPIDREVIRLAIYEKKLLREVAAIASKIPGGPKTAEAARKRLTRGLKRLRVLALRQGPVSS